MKWHIISLYSAHLSPICSFKAVYSGSTSTRGTTGAAIFSFEAALIALAKGFEEVVEVSVGRFVSMSAETVAMVHVRAQMRREAQ